MNNLPLGPLMVDIAGVSLSPADRTLLSRPAVGGVILFTRNYASPPQLAELVAAIKTLRAPALLVAVDHEGGPVQRFQDGFFPLPAAREIGRHYDRNMQQGIALAHDVGALMAGELLQVGVDISFAPVLDRANAASTIIAERAFHPDPNAISTLAGAFIKGMHSGGMAATGKHFPGHGGINQDSHLCLPEDRRTMAQLMAADLLPYRDLMPHLGAVMTAHIRFPEIDMALPGFSCYWLETVLRKNLGFNGAVFSDDLSMAGAEAVGTVDQRVDKALANGCDMVLLCNNRDAAEQVASRLGDTALKHPQRLDAMRGRKKYSAVELAVLKARLRGALGTTD